MYCFRAFLLPQADDFSQPAISAADSIAKARLTNKAMLVDSGVSTFHKNAQLGQVEDSDN